MNWFDTSGLTSFAKTALKEAQKTIDKALDIQDESSEEQVDDAETSSHSKTSDGTNTPQKDNADFFASWGLTVSAESAKDVSPNQQPVVTESPSKSGTQNVWDSYAGSFLEHPKDGECTVQPTKAKSMNVISDSGYENSDDIFTKTESEKVDTKKDSVKNDEIIKVEERRDSSRSNRLSLVSSRNSSESVEVLSHSLKTTPDSEASAHSISHSSSAGHKLNSESVEILPDSLVSPSSIECLGFDSYSSGSTSSNPSSGESSDKKTTPVGDRTETAAEAGDSVSLVADDDEDTISYNSISECTAPTVLDTDEKLSVSPNLRGLRTMEPQRKFVEKEYIQLDQPLIPQKMLVSENSSNDGSWSDRTLNADNDSITLDAAADDQCRVKEPSETEDILVDKLSDSSSFYNVTVSANVHSSSSIYVNVDKQQCNPTESNDSSQKDCTVKESTSPISSDSKSDLVKIGSDRTSGHTSGDELETTTSSDIEIIPSPNGENHGFYRNSPGKYALKQSKLDGSTSPHLVDLVLGKSLATKIRGHNRELSEASIQSNTSDESQCSENEKLTRKLCEMTDILEARECRLLEVAKMNTELTESNAVLKSQIESLMAKHEGSDIINEDYTQRMSALEKKFQQAIREKDQFRKQLDSYKCESTRKNSSEMENVVKEKDEVIAQLQEEGEKLSRQQLQHSNIIKKLRLKEKDNEQVIKGLRDKISEQTSELDRLKRAIAAKEEAEVAHIEAVYRLTSANKKLEADLAESRSAAEDGGAQLEAARVALEAARRELAELRRAAAEEAERRRRQDHGELQRERRDAQLQLESLRAQLLRLREEKLDDEKRAAARAEALRRELAAAREAEAEARAAAEAARGADGAGALLAQLAALQRSAERRERAHAHHAAATARTLAETETSLAKAVERERLAREETGLLRERLLSSESVLEESRGRLEALTEQWQECSRRLEAAEEALASKSRELEEVRSEMAEKVDDLMKKINESEDQLQGEKVALDTERKRNAILQEQLSARGDVSPPHSVASDSLSATLWPQEEGGGGEWSGAGAGAGAGVEGVEALAALAARREGELRAMAASNAALAAQRRALAARLAAMHHALDDHQTVQEQYDALLQMYGEKEEELAELRLDLQDVTQLYKAQLDELVALKQAARR